MSRIELERVSGRLRARVAVRGRMLLLHPLLNKGTAFTREERRAFDLEGLLPNAVLTLDQQVESPIAALRSALQ